MRRAVLPLLIPALMLVAACHQAEPGNSSAAVSGEDEEKGSKAVDDYVAEQQSAAAMTSVDAATGDSAGMPGDYAGPTAGQIAERQRESQREGERAAQAAMQHALDEAEQVDVNLPDPVTGEPAAGETSVVESD